MHLYYGGLSRIPTGCKLVEGSNIRMVRGTISKSRGATALIYNIPPQNHDVLRYHLLPYGRKYEDMSHLLIHAAYSL